MPDTNKHPYVDFPAEWDHLESHKAGPFVARTVHRRPDGKLHAWTSRRHRKGFGPEREEGAQKERPTLFLWRPRLLNWWIAVLFMIGSWHFVSGSILVLAGSTNTYLIDAIYFIGSIFFTAAGYSQYNQAINASEQVIADEKGSIDKKRRWFSLQPHRLGFWSTFPQFLGTLEFNITTFMAFFGFSLVGYDVFVWIPDYVGSILFLISGIAAVYEFCLHFWCWQPRSITWWIVWINFVGCVAFMISGIVAFARPDPIFDNLATWATITTLIGAVCFFVAAYLMWPEMGAEERAQA
jgi:hypothetical protein